MPVSLKRYSKLTEPVAKRLTNHRACIVLLAVAHGSKLITFRLSCRLFVARLPIDELVKYVILPDDAMISRKIRGIAKYAKVASF